MEDPINGWTMTTWKNLRAAPEGVKRGPTRHWHYTTHGTVKKGKPAGSEGERGDLGSRRGIVEGKKETSGKMDTSGVMDTSRHDNGFHGYVRVQTYHIVHFKFAMTAYQLNLSKPFLNLKAGRSL